MVKQMAKNAKKISVDEDVTGIMVQDSITDHIFDRPQFFFISSYRVMFDINGKVFSFSIGWRHSFGKIRSRIQVNPNKKLIG